MSDSVAEGDSMPSQHRIVVTFLNKNYCTLVYILRNSSLSEFVFYIMCSHNTSFLFARRFLDYYGLLIKVFVILWILIELYRVCQLLSHELIHCNSMKINNKITLI